MKEIDFTTTRWGHSLTIRQRENGKLQGFVWATPGPEVGDLLLWKTAYGSARGKVVESRWCGDPNDMYEVAVEVIERTETTV